MRWERGGGLVHCGRSISVKELSDICETVSSCTGLSRNELALTICEHLEWHRASGSLKLDACLTLLEKLEFQGVLTLPEKQIQTKLRSKKAPLVELPEVAVPLECSFGDLGPVRLVIVREKEEVNLWRAYVDKYHYLGDTRPIGCFARYFVESARGKLGCLQFSGAAKSLLERDRWIGWNLEERRRNLGFLVNNSRYLLFPWIKVKNLASHVLGQVERRIGDDWEQQWNYRPVLLETFVDPEHFSGTCYQAANWQNVGLTSGIGLPRRGKSYTSSPKSIFVKPLVADFRKTLCSGGSQP